MNGELRVIHEQVVANGKKTDELMKLCLESASRGRHHDKIIHGSTNEPGLITESKLLRRDLDKQLEHCARCQKDKKSNISFLKWAIPTFLSGAALLKAYLTSK